MATGIILFAVLTIVTLFGVFACLLIYDDAKRHGHQTTKNARA